VHQVAEFRLQAYLITDTAEQPVKKIIGIRWQSGRFGKNDGTYLGTRKYP
jgi:hypothetical protein